MSHIQPLRVNKKTGKKIVKLPQLQKTLQNPHSQKTLKLHARTAPRVDARYAAFDCTCAI